MLNAQCTQVYALIPDGEQTWIGGASSGGSWTWLDGTGFSYTKWAASEPSQNCAAMQKATGVASDNMWVGLTCSATKKYVCERAAPPFLNPATHGNQHCLVSAWSSWEFHEEGTMLGFTTRDRLNT